MVVVYWFSSVKSYFRYKNIFFDYCSTCEVTLYVKFDMRPCVRVKCIISCVIFSFFYKIRKICQIVLAVNSNLSILDPILAPFTKLFTSHKGQVIRATFSFNLSCNIVALQVEWVVAYITTTCLDFLKVLCGWRWPLCYLVLRTRFLPRSCISFSRSQLSF